MDRIACSSLDTYFKNIGDDHDVILKFMNPVLELITNLQEHVLNVHKLQRKRKKSGNLKTQSRRLYQIVYDTVHYIYSYKAK